MKKCLAILTIMICAFAVAVPQADATPRYAPVWGTPFDWMSTQYLTYDDVSDFNTTDIEIAINSVYARYGRYFKKTWLSNYFYQYSWYRPRYKDIPFKYLSAVERSNINYLKKFL